MNDAADIIWTVTADAREIGRLPDGQVTFTLAKLREDRLYSDKDRLPVALDVRFAFALRVPSGFCSVLDGCKAAVFDDGAGQTVRLRRPVGLSEDQARDFGLKPHGGWLVTPEAELRRSVEG